MQSQRISIKLIIIASLVLLSLIPLHLIDLQTDERKARHNGVEKEISKNWGESQQVTGPILVLPSRLTVKTNDSQTYSKNITYCLPDILEVNSKVGPEVRYRGIFKVVVYNIDLHYEGNFTLSDEIFDNPDKEILWDEAYILVGIPDMRGIRQEVKMKWNNDTLTFIPGTITSDLISSGMNASLKKSDSAQRSFHYSFNLNLNGSKEIKFIPIGKTTKVNVTSSWDNPSFTGAFLPTQRTINNKGFDATWEVAYFGRNFPQNWLNYESSTLNIINSFNQSSFGVSFLFPIDFYQNVERSTKYGILFIALTFLGLFLFEILTFIKIHPMHYLLVGFGMCLFYLLLLSFTEQFEFFGAYLISSSSIILLITLFVAKILKSKSKSLILCLELILLYSYLYVLLQMVDYALMLGSIGLFIILAMLMYLTRNIDWYAVNSSVKKSMFDAEMTEKFKPNLENETTINKKI
jgi:inner membrane protein